MQFEDILLTEANRKQRVDLLISQQEGIASRAMAQRLIKEGLVLVNGEPTEASYKLRPEDSVQFQIPEPESLELTPEAGDLDILFEDEHVVVLNKPPGLVVHPAPGHSTGTLVHYLLHHCQDLSGIGGVKRPGIVHRLDKDTSGVMVVAKTDLAHVNLSEQFKDHSIHKMYWALVWGKPVKSQGEVEAALGRHPKQRKKIAVREDGKPALTRWEVLERFDTVSLFACYPQTGRTHQIRTHLASIKFPIVGDQQYCRSHAQKLKTLPKELIPTFSQFQRQALHAHTLGFVHPSTQEYMEFEAILPHDFQELLQLLR